MKVRLKLKIKGITAFDPETKNHWSEGKIIESEVTPFVARALGKGVLEIVSKNK